MLLLCYRPLPETMKKTLTLLLAAFLCQIASGQDLKDIFIDLPIGGISKAEKELMIENFLSDKNGIENGVGKQRQYLVSYLPKNGFLAFSGAYEGSTAMTYWNLTNGGRLIGIEYGSCGGACDSELHFYLLTSGQLTKLDTKDVIPEISIADFFDTEQMKKDGLTKQITRDDFPDYFSFLYSLPSQGKNIIVESQTHELGEIPDEYKKYDMGPKIILIWNDGTFKKQNNGL